MRKGADASVRIIMEWVMLRCLRPGISRSMSGIMERRKVRGRFMRVLSGFWRVFADR